VIAADLGADKLEFAKGWGADATIDLATVGLAEGVKSLTAGRGADAIIDVVATPATLEASVEALGIGGRLAVVGYRPKGIFGEDWKFSVDGLLLNRGQLEIHGSRYVSHAEIRESLKLVQQRKIVPVISQTFPLEEAETAHEALRAQITTGRLALVL
jgi:D-arabinose 1-dehydrogenase-like Zn-dependent alcohol dehydrogenase